MSNFIATGLGLPRLISDEDVDQDMPIEVNDVHIGKLRILPQPSGEACVAAGANAYVRLNRIFEIMIRRIYPVRGMKEGPRKTSMSYAVSVNEVHRIERELREWTSNLPYGFRLGKGHSPNLLLCVSMTSTPPGLSNNYQLDPNTCYAWLTLMSG
jgi:hypothetical protein